MTSVVPTLPINHRRLQPPREVFACAHSSRLSRCVGQLHLSMFFYLLPQHRHPLPNPLRKRLVPRRLGIQRLQIHLHIRQRTRPRRLRQRNPRRQIRAIRGFVILSTPPQSSQSPPPPPPRLSGTLVASCSAAAIPARASIRRVLRRLVRLHHHVVSLAHPHRSPPSSPRATAPAAQSPRSAAASYCK